ncbi:MAG: hypothetical protein Q8Q50_03090 [Methylobacter sp.]|nr:hypothetical protein [Methylobacter sp.]
MNKPFLKSKGWLTLSEAAKQLALAWKCDVTEADILQLSLSRHLTLSVHFVNDVTVAPGKYFAVLKGGGDFLRSFDERFLTSSAEVSIISGCKWGLPLLLDDDRFSGNWFAIEREYHRLTRGPDVTCKGSSIKLVDSDGKSWQLQQGVSYAEYYADLLSYREKLKRFVDEKRITKEQGVEFMAQHQEKSYEFLTKLILAPPLEYSYYYPAKSLPNDAILVVQTKDLIEFEPLIDDLNYINGRTDQQQADSQAPTVGAHQQLRLNDLQGYLGFLELTAPKKDIIFDALDLPLTKRRLFKELQVRYPSFKKIKYDRFEDDWTVATRKGICANQRATERNGEIFLKSICG